MSYWPDPEDDLYMTEYRVVLTMPDYVAEGLADVIEAEGQRTGDVGWIDLAQMLRAQEGRDAEVRVSRVAA